MEIQSATVQGRVPVTILTCQGDFIDGDSLVDAVKEAIASGTADIIVDLGGVPFISSSGLRGIHSAHELVSAHHSIDTESIYAEIASGAYKSPHIKLCAPTRSGAKALAVGGFDLFLEIFDDQAAAIASF